MPSFNNIHRMPIYIYFGDLEPNASFYHDKINEHLFIGTEDYGRFSKSIFAEIIKSWEEYKSSHHFDPNMYRWIEKSQ